MAQRDDGPEFGGPEWLEMACALTERELAKSDLSGVDYVIGEEFRNVPARLNPTGSARIGWTIRVRDGRVQALPGPPPDGADARNIADWDAVEHLAHHAFGQDPAQDAAVKSEVAALVAAGRVTIVEHAPQPPALQAAFAAVHNLLACATGPRHEERRWSL